MNVPVRLALVLSLLAGLVIVFGVVATAPGESSRYFPPCLVYRTTGLHCPGCGATRATLALLRLRVDEAVQKNVLFVGLLPFALIAGAVGMTRWVRGQPLLVPAWFMRPWVPLLIVGVAIGFAVVRNLPWYPCTLLAPH